MCTEPGLVRKLRGFLAETTAILGPTFCCSAWDIFVVMLFPVLGFFDQGFYQYALVADHWQYYSIGGVIALLIAGATQLSRRHGESGRYGVMAVAVVALILLGAGTWERSSVYANSETLWRDNAAKNPNSWAAFNNLGTILWQSGRVDEARGCWEQALQIKPADYPEAQNNLATLLAQAGKFDEAIGHFEQALRAKPGLCRGALQFGGRLRANWQAAGRHRTLRAGTQDSTRLYRSRQCPLAVAGGSDKPMTLSRVIDNPARTCGRPCTPAH